MCPKTRIAAHRHHSCAACLLTAMYDGDAHVVKLHDLSFVHAPEFRELRVIEFFVGWCGHCQAFSPIYSAVAAGACSARPSLSISAIDCVRDFIICQQLGIESYPTLRIFAPGLGHNGKPLRRCVHGCKSARDVLQDILETAGPLPMQLGLPAEGADAVMARSARDPCGGGGGGGAVSPGIRVPAATEGLGLRSGEAPAELALKPRPLEDVTSAVMYGLQHELFAGRTAAAGTRRHAAREAWLGLLQASLPGAANRESMARVRRVAAGVSDAHEWTRAVGMLPTPLLPVGGAEGAIAWRACRGWSAESRGYPCGLWSLFHTLLAHATEPAAALLAIEGYVEHFFGCNACATHFLRMARDGIGGRAAERAPDGVNRGAAASAAEASIWLWRAHNAVNLRLNTSGPAAAVLKLGLPKIQWPPVSACPSCRLPSGRWRPSAVLRFLRDEYCHPQLSPCSIAAAGMDVGGAIVDTELSGGVSAAMEWRMSGGAHQDAPSLTAPFAQTMDGLLLLPPWVAASVSTALLTLVCCWACRWWGCGAHLRHHRRRSTRWQSVTMNTASFSLQRRPSPGSYYGLQQGVESLSGSDE